MKRASDLSGQRFGKWTVLERDDSLPVKRGRSPKWICVCDCGVKKSVLGGSLASGESQSCGCILAEFNANQAQKRRVDLSGQKFGRYTVLRHDAATVKDGGRMPNYICQCDCGSEPRSVGRQALVKGDAKSCGCLHKEIVSAAAHDLTGQIFGRLVVVSRSEREITRRGQPAYWLCKCECGAEKVVSAASMRSGLTKSCGCLQKEVVSTHGISSERIYRTWCGMIARCHHPNDSAFKDYGERGIKVCSEWQDVAAFRGWALKNGYTDTLTIERVDVNGDYCPENCCFISKADQARNRRDTLRFSAWGETKSVYDWFEDDRCKAPSLRALKMRFYRNAQNFDAEVALSTP